MENRDKYICMNSYRYVSLLARTCLISENRCKRRDTARHGELFGVREDSHRGREWEVMHPFKFAETMTLEVSVAGDTPSPYGYSSECCIS